MAPPVGEEASWLLTPSTVLHEAARSSLSANKASIAAVRFLGRQTAVTRAAGLRELRSLDKLSAYRNTLESGAATVTARGTTDGVETYKLRAVIPGIGGSDLEMVVEAEVRASDYLPLSHSSAFRSSDDI